MGGSISSNANQKVPITFLYTAHMMGGYSFCHAYVYCHGKKPEEVWDFIEAAYLEKTKEEIRKIAERWGSCLLDVNDDDLGCERNIFNKNLKYLEIYDNILNK